MFANIKEMGFLKDLKNHTSNLYFVKDKKNKSIIILPKLLERRPLNRLMIDVQEMLERFTRYK